MEKSPKSKLEKSQRDTIANETKENNVCAPCVGESAVSATFSMKQNGSKTVADDNRIC